MNDDVKITVCDIKIQPRLRVISSDIFSFTHLFTKRFGVNVDFMTSLFKLLSVLEKVTNLGDKNKTKEVFI